ncbi:hypothetical protein Mal15_63830 [Stieleria maiorica]|uniref:Uncharacterized protein n=1 Tax=Stieleria maiorica TaxID=2795974 RepID=A0A5B9MR90_9BACT|nr:hypothetical protein Mal15_63830 [Stieleria maiorica]
MNWASESGTSCCVAEQVVVAGDANDAIELVGKRIPNGSYVTGSATLIECGVRIEVAGQKHANPPVGEAEIWNYLMGKDRRQDFTEKTKWFAASRFESLASLQISSGDDR